MRFAKNCCLFIGAAELLVVKLKKIIMQRERDS